MIQRNAIAELISAPPRAASREIAARRLAEAGCTAKQIQAITGHKTLAEVERYTRKADQVRLARQPVEKLKEADGEFASSPENANCFSA